MSDAALKNAKIHKEQLLNEKIQTEQRLEEIGLSLARVEVFISNWHAFSEGNVESSDSFELDSKNKNETYSRRSKHIRDNPSKEEVARTARYLIGVRGEPISRPELLILLEQEGLRIHGADPLKVLSTMLWRMKDKVVNFSRVGYWLADEPWAPEGYDPKTEIRRQEAADGELGEVERGQYQEDLAQDEKWARNED